MAVICSPYILRAPSTVCFPVTRSCASDMALSLASDYLYQLNSFEGTINAYRVGANGALTLVQTVHAHAPSKTAAPMGLAAR